MRTSRIRTSAVFAAAVAALSGVEAAAQQLFPVVGIPVAYEVSLPVGWESDNSDPGLLVVQNDGVVIMVGAVDLMAVEGETGGGPMNDAELKERRRLTQRVVQDDSVLMSMVDAMFPGTAELTDKVREVRTLGGQRSAYARGRYTEDGESGWLELHVTLRDGILYLLMFSTEGDSDTHAELLGRVRQSFVLAK